MTNLSGRGKCTVCLSPMRPEIESLLKKGVPVADLSKTYYQAFNNTENTLYMKLRNHVKRKHPPRIVDTVAAATQVEERAVQAAGGTVEDYAASLLNIGMSADMLKPGKVSHSHVIASQKLLIDKEKLKIGQDSMKLAMIQFMRGTSAPIEGEVVDVRSGTIESNTK